MNLTIRWWLGAGLLAGLLGLSGCSDQEVVSGSKKQAESKRDEIQKATQSGVPGKAGAGARGGRG